MKGVVLAVHSGNGGVTVSNVYAADAPNQLKYPTPPPDKTVVTWCTYHSAVARSNIINVLLLSGNARPVPTDQFVNQGPVNFKF